VIFVINTKTTVDLTIDDVSQIRACPVTDAFYDGHQRFITVETSHGEIYCLRLKAQFPEKLEIRELPDVEDNWLKPKVYKGKSMAELGEDQPEAE
jgi:hypothetical protein